MFRFHPVFPFFSAALVFAALASHSQVPAGYAGKPYQDSIQSVPGILQPERYDEGASGVTWFDTDAHIGAHTARNPTGVDLDPVKTDDPTMPGSTVKAVAGSVYWGWLVGNEWLKMTVDVKHAGAYSIHAMVGTAMTGASFRVDALQGSDSVSSGTLVLPFGGTCPVECYHYWNYAQNLGSINLKAGQQVIRLQIVKSGYNIEYVELKQVGATTVRRLSGKHRPVRGETGFDVLGRMDGAGLEGGRKAFRLKP